MLIVLSLSNRRKALSRGCLCKSSRCNQPSGWLLGGYSDENTCYNIAMAQVSIAQEGKLPEMH